MKTLFNIIKIILSIIIFSAIVLGIVMIVRNVSSLTEAFEGTKQTVMNAATVSGTKQVRQVILSVDSIVF